MGGTEVNKTLIVNLFGGPGSGKTSVATGVFSDFRKMGIKAHFAEEYAKELVGDQNWMALNNQIHVFGEQHRRITRWIGKVDIIVTDSPLLLTRIYGRGNYPALDQLALDEHRRTDSANFFIERPTVYESGLGRSESEQRSISIDNEILSMLKVCSVEFIRLPVGTAREDIIRLLGEL